MERKKGFDDYFESIGLTDMVHESSFSVMNPEDNEKDILEFMEEFPRTRSIAVLNSRGYIIADILDSLGIGKVKMIYLIHFRQEQTVILQKGQHQNKQLRQ